MHGLLNRFPTGSTDWENFWILTADSSKNKESKKRNDTQFRAWMRENWLKQGNVFIKWGWSCRSCWTDSWSVQPLEKNYEMLTTDSPKNKESNKRNGAQFWAQIRENRLKQCNVFTKRGWSCMIGSTGWEKFQNFNSRFPKE